MAASELINFDELGTRLLELEETRQSAERKLKIVGTHKERVAELEADRDALLTSLIDLVPIALDSLTPEERRRFYKLLGLRVIVYPDRSLEVEFGDGLNVRERETAQEYSSQSTSSATLWLRATLSAHGLSRPQFKRTQ